MDLLVLAKEPRPGRVKTRLSPPCTPDESADIAAAALADTLAAAVASGADRVVVGLEGRPGDWCPPGVHVVDQGEGALEDRLERLWSHASGPAVQIGMDTPQVGAVALDGAIAALDGPSNDAVLGLAADGGWWCLGLVDPGAHRGRVFAGIATSRADTGARQLERLASLGLRTAALPVVRDVDTWADATAVARSVPSSRFAAAVDRVRAEVGP